MASYFSGLARDLGITEDTRITDDAIRRDVRRVSRKPVATKPAVVPTVYVHPAPEDKTLFVPPPKATPPIVPVATDVPPPGLVDPPGVDHVAFDRTLTPSQDAEIDRVEILETPTLLMALAVGGGLLWLLSQP